MSPRPTDSDGRATSGSEIQPDPRVFTKRVIRARQSYSAYELSDPKHPTYYDRMADIWDMREGK